VSSARIPFGRSSNKKRRRRWRSLNIASPGFGEFGKEEKEEEEEEEQGPLLSHAAFTTGFGHLLVASHMDYLEEVLNRGAVSRRWTTPRIS